MRVAAQLKRLIASVRSSSDVAGSERTGAERIGPERIGPEQTGPEHVELITSRAAVLLRGGVPAPRVFAALSGELPHIKTLRTVADVVQGGKPVAEALAAGPGPEWRALAAAWDLAEHSGAPLAPALDEFGAALRSLSGLRHRRRVLLAGPRATVRLVAALPVLAVLLGSLLGFDPLGVLLTPGGMVLLGSGALLLALGVLWAQRMTARVESDDGVAGLEFVLCWIALGGGSSTDAALVRLADSVDRARSEWVPFACLRRDAALHSTLAAAAELGAPVGSLLLEEAGSRRGTAHAELERAAEKLGIRVLIPLGVCTLPAFIILGVIPVLIAMLEPVVGP